MTDREKLYSLLGELACAFSTMEFAVEQLLARMVNTKNVVLAGLVINDWPLSKKQQKIQMLCPWVLLQDQTIRDEIFKVMIEIDAVRTARNAFIHGQWVIDDQNLKKGQATCLDTRWTIKKAKDATTGRNTYTAHKATSTSYSFKQIEDQTTKAKDITKKLTELQHRLYSQTITV